MISNFVESIPSLPLKNSFSHYSVLQLLEPEEVYFEFPDLVELLNENGIERFTVFRVRKKGIYSTFILPIDTSREQFDSKGKYVDCYDGKELIIFKNGKLSFVLRNFKDDYKLNIKLFFYNTFTSPNEPAKVILSENNNGEAVFKIYSQQIHNHERVIEIFYQLGRVLVYRDISQLNPHDNLELERNSWIVALNLLRRYKILPDLDLNHLRDQIQDSLSKTVLEQ